MYFLRHMRKTLRFQPLDVSGIRAQFTQQQE